MELYNHQYYILDKIYFNRFLYIQSQRALGVSLTLQAFALTEALTNGKTIIVFTQLQLFRYWTNFIKSHTFDEEILDSQKNSFVFRNNGKILLKTLSVDGIRGHRSDIVIFDDILLSRVKDEMIYSIIPALDRDSRFIISGIGQPNFELGRFGFHRMDLHNMPKNFKLKKIKSFIKKNNEGREEVINSLTTRVIFKKDNSIVFKIQDITYFTLENKAEIADQRQLNKIEYING